MQWDAFNKEKREESAVLSGVMKLNSHRPYTAIKHPAWHNINIVVWISWDQQDYSISLFCQHVVQDPEDIFEEDTQANWLGKHPCDI